MNKYLTAVLSLSFWIVGCNPLGANLEGSKFDDQHLKALASANSKAKSPSLSYGLTDPVSGMIGVPLEVKPSLLESNGAEITACEIESAKKEIPAWLIIDSKTCVISGTPSQGLELQTIQVKAINSAGTSDLASLELSVEVVAPESLVRLDPSGSTGNDPTPSFRISGGSISSGISAQLFSDANCLTAVSAEVESDSDAVDVTTRTLVDGSYTFYARSISNGVESDCSVSSLSYSLDTQAPTLNSVQVASALTVDVTFSEAMGSGVLTASNYVISGSGKGSLNSNPDSVAITSGNTYRLTWSSGAMNNGADVIVSVTGATDLAGNAVNASATHVGGAIGNLPSVSSVVVASAVTVDVTFSEPMSTGVTTASNYTATGTGLGTLAANPNSVALVTGNTYRLTWTSGEMKNGGNISIAVANAQSSVGTVISSSGTHTGGAIGTAPTVSSVTVQTALTVDVAFTEAMSTGVTTASNYTAAGTGLGTLAANPNSVALVSGNTYRLTWTSGEMKSGGNITISVANAIDTAGNAISSSATHTGGAIGIAPTVSSVTVQTALTVDVTFTEAMSTGVTTASNYTATGTGLGTFAANPNSVALVSGNTYRLTWTSGEMRSGGNITISVANAIDTAGNAISSNATHTGGAIGTAPTVSSVAVNSVQTVDVTFDEAMGSGVTTASNYTVTGTGKNTLAANPNSVALASGNTYRLTWTSGVMTNGGNITIAVANAQDSAGNVVSSSGTHTGGATAPTLSYGNTSGTRGSAITTNSPTVTAGTGATVPATGAYALASGTFPTGVSINADSGAITGTPTTVQSSTSYTVSFTNSAGQTITSSSFTIAVDEQWTDSSNSSTIGFAGGSHTGTSWDSTNSYVRLAQTGTPLNNSELDSSWTPQWSSLLSYWKLNETTWNGTANEVVDSKGNNHGTSAGPTSTTSSKIGSRAASIATNWIAASSTSTLDGASEATFAAWIKWGGSAGGATSAVAILGKSNQARFEIAGDTASKLNLYINDGSWVSSGAGATSIDDGNWHHVVGTYSASNISVYVDGLVDKSTSVTRSTLATSAAEYRIGSYGSAETWTGTIDDVAIWSKALTAAEVQLLFSRQSGKYAGTFQSRVFNYLSANSAWDGFKWLTTLPFGKELPGDVNASSSITADDSESTTYYSALANSTLMSDLAGLWHFNGTNEASIAANASISDSSGNSLTMTAKNANASGMKYRYGRFDQGISFDGTDDYMQASANTVLDVTTSDITLSAWFRYIVAPTASYPSILAKYDNTPNQGYSIFAVQNQTTIRFTVGIAGTVLNLTSASGLNDGVWHQVVGVRSGAVIYLYIDGIESTHATHGSGAGSLTNTKTFNIGAKNSVNVWNGQLDEVAMWNRALSATEVLQLYRRGSNRVKVQVRACSTSDCSDDPTWRGTDGTSGTYFSELVNTKPNNYTNGDCNVTSAIFTGNPDLWFQCFSSFASAMPTTRQYFQYRAILESDDLKTGCDYSGSSTWCSPELKSVQVRP